MYSTARKMALLSAIACAINVVGLILFLMVSSTLITNFAASFAIVMFMASSAAISLMLTIGLRSICQDLEYEFEDTVKKFHDINEKIKEIEYKL